MCTCSKILKVTNSNYNIFIVLSAILAFIFIIFYPLDLKFSELFYTSSEGFYLNRNIFLIAIHEAVPWIVILLSFSYLSLLALSFANINPVKSLARPQLVFLIVTLIVGPGIIVNSLLKEYSGRARPIHNEYYGGDKKFSKALTISNQCQSNCSFTSGDASVGFSLFAFAFIFKRRKILINITAILAGSFIGMARIMQGLHFASDVIFSGIFVYATCLLIYWILKKFTRLDI